MRRTVAILLVAICAASLFPGPVSAQQEPRAVNVGALLPLTGAWSSLGEGAKAALQMAEYQIIPYLHRQGSTLGLFFEDTQGDPALALQYLQEFKAMGIRIVIGPMTSEEVAAVVNYANENDMLLISPSSTAPSLANPDNLLRLSPNDIHQSLAVAFLMSLQGLATALPVYVDDTYGQNLQQEFGEWFAEYDGTTLDGIAFSSSAPDYDSLILAMESALQSASPAFTGIFFIGSDSHATGLFSRIPEGSILGNFRWYTSETIAGNDLVTMDPAAASFAARTRLTGFSFEIEDTPFDIHAHYTLEILKSILGSPPTPFALSAYDALWLAVELRNLEPDDDFDTFRDGAIDQAWQLLGLSGFGWMDDNGDKVDVLYTMQRASETGGEYSWHYAGYYEYNPFMSNPELGLFTSYGIPSATPGTTVKIGALLPLTGSFSDEGKNAEASVNLALEHVNDYFDLSEYGLQFELALEDTQTNPAVALQKIQELHDQGVNVVIGPMTSAEVAAIEAYVAETGMSVISPSSTAPSLAKPDRIMRLIANDTHQVKALAALMEVQEITNVAIIYRNDVYGNDLSTAFAEAFSGTILTSLSYGPNEVDFGSLLASVEQSLPAGSLNTTAVLAIGFEELISLLKQIPVDSPLGDVKWYGTDGMAGNHLLLEDAEAVAVASKIRFTCSSPSWDAYGVFSVQEQILKFYLTQEQGEMGSSLSLFQSTAHDALWLTAMAYRWAGADGAPERLWEELEWQANVTMGTQGPLGVDENGDREMSAYQFDTVDAADGVYQWTTTAFYRDAEFGSGITLLEEPTSAVAEWDLYK
ncbi:MAG: ABC transporter substrate-binding protein [bacterium]